MGFLTCPRWCCCDFQSDQLPGRQAGNAQSESGPSSSTHLKPTPNSIKKILQVTLYTQLRDSGRAEETKFDLRAALRHSGRDLILTRLREHHCLLLLCQFLGRGTLPPGKGKG